MSTALTLVRIESNDYATYGHIEDEEHKVLVPATLELPWRDNARGVSCVPAGDYTLRRRFSEQHGYALFGVEGVPDRGDIELHIGCFPKDTRGCVLLGSRFWTFDEGHGISGSTEAFERFMGAMQGIDALPFTIRDPA